MNDKLETTYGRAVKDLSHTRKIGFLPIWRALSTHK
jgi:hypothetical protein